MERRKVILPQHDESGHPEDVGAPAPKAPTESVEPLEMIPAPPQKRYEGPNLTKIRLAHGALRVRVRYDVWVPGEGRGGHWESLLHQREFSARHEDTLASLLKVVEQVVKNWSRWQRILEEPQEDRWK